MTTASLPPTPTPELHLVHGPETTSEGRHPRLEGTFRAPDGRTGRLSGCLRLELLILTRQSAFVSGVVTGHLHGPDGEVVAAATRPVTCQADLVHEGARTRAQVRPFDLDMMGIPVHVAGFSVEPTVAVATDEPVALRVQADPSDDGGHR